VDRKGKRMTTTFPNLIIDTDGLPLLPVEMNALQSVRVQQRLSQPGLCELVFSDPPGFPISLNRLNPGSKLKIYIVGNLFTPLFNGQVTAVEYIYEPGHGKAVRIRAYDLLHVLRKRQTVRSFESVNVKQLAERLAGEVGLEVKADEDGVTRPKIIQHRQSDLELLVDEAERNGLYLSVRDNVLHIFSLEGTDNLLDVSLLTLGDNLLEAQFEINADQTAESVTATGWSPFEVETYTAQVSTARSGRLALAGVSPDEVGASEGRTLPDAAIISEDYARAMAQAELDRRTATEVVFQGVANGSPRLRPGSAVLVKGVAPQITGKYILTAVTHLINQRLGYVAELSTVPPPQREKSNSTITTFGVVSGVNNKGQVKVRLPTYNDVETEWMNVLVPGAGNGKGLIALPDVDDQVLVLLIHADPANGLVLGGLYGKNSAPDYGIEDDRVKRFTFLTAGGQKLYFDDVNNIVRIENSDDSYLEMSPEKVKLHSRRDLDLEAPGQTVTISGKNINFTRT
jgi:phage protein D/phage baseplate assembly protein gpV